MTVDEAEPPDKAEMEASIKVIHDHADRIFLWNYDRERDQLVTLYNKAMSSQWNSITELDLPGKGIGVPGAIVLSKLLPSAAALTSLKCACGPKVFAFASAPADIMNA